MSVMRFAEHPETSPYQQGLARNPANFVPLTPISFLERTADVFPDRLAVVHGGWRSTYAGLRERSRRLASALGRRGVKPAAYSAGQKRLPGRAKWCPVKAE